MIDKTKILQWAKDVGLATNSPYLEPRDEVMNAYTRLCELAQADAQAAIAELETELQGCEYTIIAQGELLRGVANAVRGEPEPGTSHSHHDLPERVAEMMQRLKRSEGKNKIVQSIPEPIRNYPLR